jgi:hypothetical protein
MYVHTYIYIHIYLYTHMQVTEANYEKLFKKMRDAGARLADLNKLH